MLDLRFECTNARADTQSAGPTLVFDLHVREQTGATVEGLMLRCQFRVEPQLRNYSEGEAQQLADVFGPRSQWRSSLLPMQLATVSHLVPRFCGECNTQLPLPCSYDMEVATGKYFHSLSEGIIPLIVMFSGTAFVKAEQGLAVEQVPWHLESRYRLGVAVWQEMMNAYFPGASWLRLRRETIDRLRAVKTAEALATWDDLMDRLVKEAGW